MNAVTKTCQQCQAQFTLTAEDLAMYTRADIPPATLCIYCNWSQLLAFWILGRFRVAKSALSGKQIITNLPETAPFPIYEREEFVSDAWDPLSYGQDYDSSRSFFEQLMELQRKVPHPHQLGNKNVKCEWTDDWWESKECYLCRSGWRNEFLSYAYRSALSKDSIDITYCFNTEQAYDCLHCFKCYKIQYSFNCHDCVESAFLYDSRNCSNCFMSWNLRNKQYCILNEQYTKEEYFEKLKEYDLRSYKAVQVLKRQWWGHIAKDAVHRANWNIQVVDSTGNFLENDRNCSDCVFFEHSDNCRRILRGYTAKDSIEAICCAFNERSSRTALDQFGYGNTCVLYATNCRYSFYLDACEESEYCFGSIGLRKKKYCVLNKQYTKDQYEELVTKIKSDMQARGEWGQFMPLEMAYGGYNLSLAQLQFPKTKKEAEAFGAKWEEQSTPMYTDAILSDQLPDSIDDVADDITKRRIICSQTKLSYNIAPRELAFYRQYGIPLPQRHFDYRTFEGFRPLALMVKPQQGICYYCKQPMIHYYDPLLGFEKIACVECYQKNIA